MEIGLSSGLSEILTKLVQKLKNLSLIKDGWILKKSDKLILKGGNQRMF